MSIDVINLGETRYINGYFYDQNELLADPDTVTIKIMPPSGTLTQEDFLLSPSGVEKIAVGVYRRITVFNEIGDWRWQWEGTGTVQDVEPGQCVVQGHGF